MLSDTCHTSAGGGGTICGTGDRVRSPTTRLRSPPRELCNGQCSASKPCPEVYQDLPGELQLLRLCSCIKPSDIPLTTIIVGPAGFAAFELLSSGFFHGEAARNALRALRPLKQTYAAPISMREASKPSAGEDQSPSSLTRTPHGCFFSCCSAFPRPGGNRELAPTGGVGENCRRGSGFREGQGEAWLARLQALAG